MRTRTYHVFSVRMILGLIEARKILVGPATLQSMGSREQREWDRELVAQVVRGGDVPPVWLSSVVDPQGNVTGMYEVYEGRERMMALVRFAADEFSIELDGVDKRIGDVSERFFSSQPFITVWSSPFHPGEQLPNTRRYHMLGVVGWVK